MIIIDGHNVSFADDEIRKRMLAGDHDGARERLVDLVEAFARETHEDALIIFDGTGGGRTPTHTRGRVSYAFSGADKTADSEILRILRGSTGRRDTTLVTSDRELGAGARRLKAKTLTAGQFLTEAVKALEQPVKEKAPEPRAKRTGAGRADVEYWLKIWSDKDIEKIEREEETKCKIGKRGKGKKGK